MIFPRMAALSEILWTAKEKKDLTHFKQKLAEQTRRYQLWQVNYCKSCLSQTQPQQ